MFECTYGNNVMHMPWGCLPMNLFVTGTDTHVGKTWICAAIAQQAVAYGASVSYYKPIETGVPTTNSHSDVGFMDTALLGQVQTYSRYRFAPPVAPAVADTQNEISPATIYADVQRYAKTSDLLLVEGAGGLAVPICSDMLMLDLIRKLRLEVLLVARSQLGTLNHTLLSVEALLNRDIPIRGIVLNYYPCRPERADLATQTVIPTLQQHLPKQLPIWLAYAYDRTQSRVFETTLPVTEWLQKETHLQDSVLVGG